MRKRIISALTIFTIMLTALVAGFPAGAGTMSIRASQGSDKSIQDLFSETNTFNFNRVNPINGNLEFNLNNRNNEKVMPVAQITVLTHGLGSGAGC
jgi:hypothetical protein